MNEISELVDKATRRKQLAVERTKRYRERKREEAQQKKLALQEESNKQNLQNKNLNIDLVVNTENPEPQEELEMHRNGPPLHFSKRSRTEPSSSELQQAYNIMKMVSNNIRPSDEYSAFGDVVGHKIRKLKTDNLRNLAQMQINDILYELAMSSENGQEEPSAWSSNTAEVVDVKVEVEEIDPLSNAEK